MKLFEKLLVMLVPALTIRPKWRQVWDQRDQLGFLKSARIYFIFCSIGYIAHYYLIDLPLHKEPEILWAQYRFGAAAVAAIGLALSFVPAFRHRILTRAPLIASGVLFSYLQARSMFWRSETPYIYSVLIPCIAAVALRASILGSSFLILAGYVVSYSAWAARPAELPYALSAAIVGALCVFVIRSRMSLDVETFLAEQEKLETQARLIEAQLELNEQVRAFLPKEIYRRILEKNSREKMTVLQAMDEVLRCRRAMVTCIHSDIRGFTQKSKDLGRFVGRGALPDMRAATDLIEERHGIPRQIGDLVFGYFEDYESMDGYVSGIQAALLITQKNHDLNSKLPLDLQVNRHVLVSYGEAIVGNTGGSDSSREITVLGPPANILNRVDSLSKDPKLKMHMLTAGIILTAGAASKAIELGLSPWLVKIDLKSEGLEIRDFPEEDAIFMLPVTNAVFGQIGLKQRLSEDIYTSLRRIA